MQSISSTPTARTKHFVAWTLRHARTLWALALVLAIPAGYRTISLYAHLNSELDALLPRESKSVAALEELRARTAGLHYLGIVVDANTADRVPEAIHFIDDLTEKLRSYPSDLVRRVRVGSGEERAFLEKHAALYLDTTDLQAIDERIRARRDFEVRKQTGSDLDDDAPPPSLDFSDIEQKYQAKLPKRGKSDGERYASRELHAAMALIEVGDRAGKAAGKRELLARVKADIAALGTPAKYARGMTFGFSGDVAISVEETEALMQDLSVSSVLVILAVALVIVVYYRWWRSVLVLVPPLLLSTFYAFAIASLPPFNVTELNSNTAFLASIIVGNGINFGIILVARYVEERRRGVAKQSALEVAVFGARGGTITAALAAGISYASLVVTQFRGFRQFGFIGGIGMVVCWGVSFLLMPPLLAWFDDGKGAIRPEARVRSFVMERLANFVGRFAPAIMVAATLLSVAAGWKVSGFRLDQIEQDFSKLRRADTWKNGEGLWGRKMDALLGTYLTPLVILADDNDQAQAIAADVRDAVKTKPLSSMVANVRTAEDLVPVDQEKKVALAVTIQDDLTPKIRSLIPENRKEFVERYIGTEPPKPFTLADVPEALTTGMRERSGAVGRTVLVYPRPSHELWEGAPMANFVGTLRAIGERHRHSAVGTHASPPEERGARVAGSLPLSVDILSSIERDGPIANGIAFVGVALVVILLFRLSAVTIYVVTSLIVGVLWLAGATLGLGVKINFANFIAFPITFGIGVDYPVNVMSRFDEEGRADVLSAIRSTGGAVALCSLTTIIGYSSLLLAENRALYLFGLVAVLGELACLSVAIIVLPAALVLVRGGPKT